MTELYNGCTITRTYDQEADDLLTWTPPEERCSWFALSHERYVLPFDIDADVDGFDSWTELAAAVTDLTSTPGGSSSSYIKVLLSWGGPGDWLQIELDNASGHDVARVTYHYADWFDHAEREVSEHEAPALWRAAAFYAESIAYNFAGRYGVDQ